MKKILIPMLLAVLLTISGAANAHPGGHGGHGGYGGHGGGGNGFWVAPLIVGGLIGYELSQPSYAPAPYQPVYVQPPSQPYERVYGYDPTCNCYRYFLRPVYPQ